MQGNNYSFYIFNFSEEKDLKKNGMIMKRKYEKRDAVSYILLISKIQILAASYFNGIIILWDTLLMEQRKVYKDHKTVKIKTQMLNLI